MNEIILNVIMLIFPVLMYFFYKYFRLDKGNEYDLLVFDIVILTSLYLCFKFGGIYSLLFCNIPIMVSYYRNRLKLGIGASCFCLIYIFLVLKLEGFIYLFSFVSYLLIYLIKKYFSVNMDKYVRGNFVLMGFFVAIEYFKYIGSDFFSGILFISLFMFGGYWLFYFLIKIIESADEIVSLYFNNVKLERDVKLSSSLFKITHEVKNPIAVCKGYLEMFDVNDKEEASRFVSIIKSEIDRSLDIMADFMEFGKIKVNYDIMDINMLIEEIEEEFQFFVKNKKISLSCKCIDDEIFVNGDYNRLKQVFVNLLKNSIEAIEEDGCINIATHILKGYYYIEITDNGCGMAKVDLERVKEMFFTTKVSGNGLGVSLANEIVRLHNGFLNYYSKEGIGTRVVVKLPIVVL